MLTTLVSTTPVRAAAAAAAADDDDDGDDVCCNVGSDVFLDGSVRCYLTQLLRLYCKPSQLDRMDFTQPVPGLASFHDLYV